MSGPAILNLEQYGSGPFYGPKVYRFFEILVRTYCLFQNYQYYDIDERE